MESGKRDEKEDMQNHHHPWLLITDDSRKGEKQYLYSISKNRFHPTFLAPELEGGTIVLASAYGWLVLAEPTTDYTYLWNPISMDKTELGIFKYSFQYNVCVMSKPPSEPDCHLVFYSTCGDTQVFIRLVDDETVVQLLGEDAMLMTAAAFRGTIYAFLVKPVYGFVTLHFGEETVEYRPIDDDDGRPWRMPWPTREWALRMDFHMIESPCGQELLLVHKMYLCDFNVSDGFDFRVFRVDVDRKECVELDNIGDRAIFLSYNGCGFCCSSSSDAGTFRRNCIYYTIEKGKSRCVYIYDLNDRSIRSLLPCPVASRTRSQSCWVQKPVLKKLL